jgi:hypothetical protein
LEYLHKQEEQTSKYYAYRPYEDYSKIDVLSINGKEYKLDFTFKNVMRFIKLMSSKYSEQFKISKGLEIFGFKEDLALETKSFIMSKIIDYLFKSDKASSGGQRLFDLELDYKYYYCDFKNIGNGIDLNKDDISWWEFDTLLEGIFLKKESTIGQIVSYRAYKKPSKNVKAYEQEEYKFYISKQRQYALPNTESAEEGLQKLWGYLENKVKKQSEVVTNE